VLSLVRDDARPALTAEQTAAVNAQGVTAVPAPAAPGAAPTAAAAPASTAPRRVFEIPIRSTSSGFWSGLVHVEGVGKPTNFIIDTGATVSVVSTQLNEREELSRFEQKFRLSVYGAAGVTEDVPMLMLPRVSLGDYTHANLAAAVLDMNPINETTGFEQAGILGGNILRYFRVTFDFQRAVLRLEMIPNYTPPPISKEANITPQGLE
ncbi:MAG: aspartyl protease family protein, partial [Pyrinomonadaceae bacterium]